MSSSNTNSNQTVPGMLYPTQKGYVPGAGNPRDSAIQQMSAVNNKQASLNAAVGGYKRRKGRGGAPIPVPQMQTMYTPQGGPGTDPNSQIATNMATSTQGNANAVYDKQALVTGGSRKGRRGGNPDWHWGCYSGGKKTRRNKRTKRAKKSRKSRKIKSRRY